MDISYGEKLYGYELVEREKIQPARELPPIVSEEDRKIVTAAAKTVIDIHREVLIALKDR